MTADEARVQLAELLRRNGNVRFPRESSAGSGTPSKKGWEIRWVAYDWDEAHRIREFVLMVGLKPGRPYVKHVQIVQPVYGRVAVEMFLGSAQSSARGSKRPAATKRLVAATEKDWLASLSVADRKLIMMRRFYDRFLADDSGREDEGLK
jgi:hypothetical protein